MPFIVATYLYASSQGQRTHSARTKIIVVAGEFGRGGGRMPTLGPGEIIFELLELVFQTNHALRVASIDLLDEGAKVDAVSDLDVLAA